MDSLKRKRWPMSKWIPDKQLSIPGLPVPEPKVKKPMTEGHLASLESRILKLELEVSLLRILVEKGS